MTTQDLKKMVDRLCVFARTHEEVAECLKEPENVAFHEGSARAFAEAAKLLADSISCGTCNGDGTVDYQTGGSNEDLIHADCPTCKGEGVRS